MSLTKRVVVSGYKEMDNFNLNVHFEIYNGSPWMINFDFTIEDIHVNGQYADRIRSYNVSGGFIPVSIMESVQQKLDEIKDEYKDEFLEPEIEGEE